MTKNIIHFQKNLDFSDILSLVDINNNRYQSSANTQHNLFVSEDVTLTLSGYLNKNKVISTFQRQQLSIDNNKTTEKFHDKIDTRMSDVEKTSAIKLTIGVDEAGRGPLLGSVVVGAVILPPELCGKFESLSLEHTAISQLNDSKKISEKKRDDLYSRLDSVALGYVSVEVPAGVIDEVNILQASLLGMKIATESLIEQLSVVLTTDMLSVLSLRVLFDGNKVPTLNYQAIKNLGIIFDTSHAISVVKGDAMFTNIAMASVLAKVERDRQMYALAKRYPHYGIDKHKGYPTKAHFACLEKYGVLAEHRRSFSPVRKCLTTNC